MTKDQLARRKRRILFILLIILPTFLFYSGTLRNRFVWDDDQYIYRNPLLLKPDGLARIWKSFSVRELDPEIATPQYYPLVFTTFYLEYKLWGLNPAGYHLTNVLLHSLNAVLLFFLLQKLGLTPGFSLVTALLFAVHPVQVETVAWATERKNVLSTLFYFAAFISFLRHEDTRNPRDYAGSLFCFFLALLSKTVAATLPVALLLASYLRRRSPGRILSRTMPFFLLGLVMGLLTSWVERVRVGAYGPEWNLSFLQRLLIACRALWFYPGKLVFPYPLSFFYPRWEIDTASFGSYLPLLGVAAVTFVLWRNRRRVDRLIIFGPLYFIATLSPALGFINFYPMRFSFVADHFQYLACWGMLAVVARAGQWLIEKTMAQRRHVIDAGRLTTMGICICGALTVHQVRKYKNEEILWRHTIATNPKAWEAHYNLGVILLSREQFLGAVGPFRRTIELNPYYAEGYNNLGVALDLSGHPNEAIKYYQKAIELKPGYQAALDNLEAVYELLGHPDR